MAVALPRRWSTSAGLALSAATVLFLIWQSGTIPSSIDARIRSATDELTTVEDVRGVDITTENYAIIERLAHWQAGLNMIAAHPFAGVGFGNYEIAYDNYRLINWDEPLGHAHNYYLNVFAETGIIGATGYVFLWVIIIIRTWSARSHPDDLTRVVAAGLMGTWAYLSVHSLTDNLYVNNLFLHIGVLLGVLGVIDEQSHRSYRVTWHEFFSR
jgi:O-antigen ligase